MAARPRRVAKPQAPAIAIRLDPTAIPEPANEESFRHLVRNIAHTLGWDLKYHTGDSRRSDPGWPDEVLGHHAQRRTLFVELKTNRGHLRPEQARWLSHLASCGFEVALWRPRDIPTILRVLGPHGERAQLPPDIPKARPR